jgi:hypothetical protein
MQVYLSIQDPSSDHALAAQVGVLTERRVAFSKEYLRRSTWSKTCNAAPARVITVSIRYL